MVAPAVNRHDLLRLVARADVYSLVVVLLTLLAALVMWVCQ